VGDGFKSVSPIYLRRDLMDGVTVALIGVIGTIIGTIGTGLGNMIMSWWNDKQLDFKINDAINDAIEAVEKESKTRSELKGQEKYKKCVDFTNALMEYRGISVKPILLEVKIHNKLAKMDNEKVDE